MLVHFTFVVLFGSFDIFDISSKHSHFIVEVGTEIKIVFLAQSELVIVII